MGPCLVLLQLLLLLLLRWLKPGELEAQAGCHHLDRQAERGMYKLVRLFTLQHIWVHMQALAWQSLVSGSRVDHPGHIQ